LRAELEKYPTKFFFFKECNLRTKRPVEDFDEKEF
jgi:hypothetical protein